MTLFEEETFTWLESSAKAKTSTIHTKATYTHHSNEQQNKEKTDRIPIREYDETLYPFPVPGDMIALQANPRIQVIHHSLHAFHACEPHNWSAQHTARIDPTPSIFLRSNSGKYSIDVFLVFLVLI
jgi:disulfide oxidoreductase YuzD